MEKDYKSVRKITRLALPVDDSYLYNLGVALYGFNSINSFMIEIICHANQNESSMELIQLTSGGVLDKFRSTLSYLKKEKLFQDTYIDFAVAAGLFEKLNSERSDFVHSYPITNKKGEQILHRRQESKSKYFEVDNIFLEDFISRLDSVSSLLYKIRSVIKPSL